MALGRRQCVKLSESDASYVLVFPLSRVSILAFPPAFKCESRGSVKCLWLAQILSIIDVREQICSV